MWDTEPPENFEEKMFQFIESSISKIHQTQDAEAYMQWVQTNYTDFFPAFDTSLKMALLIASSIWDVTPLSSNRYRPSSLPELKHSSPCRCGSGKKFKQCCLQMTNLMPPLDSQDIWVILLEKMSTQEVEEALAIYALPIFLILDLADQYQESDMVEAVIEILEPVFTLPSDKMREDECAALTMLCNAYDAIRQPEMHERKMQLLHQLKDRGSHLIRSEAWQRLSVILIDKDEKKSAWEAFREAQRLTPNSSDVDLLEINLLIGEKKADLVQQRAKVILKKMQRNGVYDDSRYTDFFLSVANDPQKVIDEVFTGQAVR